MEEVKEKVNFKLPNEVIVVKHIPRKVGMASDVKDDHIISGGMLEGSRKGFPAPLLRNGSIANVLTSEEKIVLEELTGLDLSVYKDFWTNHLVYLSKGDNRFDLSQPMDYISYKILLALKDDIAVKWEDRFKKQTYQFVITSDSDVLAEKKQSFDKKKEAFKLYGKIEDDREKLISIFKLLSNKPIATNSKLEWIQTKVEEHIEANPKSFVELMKDSSLDTKLLINKGIEKGVVIKSGNKYSTSDGLDLCENSETPTINNAVRYLDNPKHQDVRALIEAKTNK